MLFNMQLLLFQKHQKMGLAYCFYNWQAIYWDGADGDFGRDRYVRVWNMYVWGCFLCVGFIGGKKSIEQAPLRSLRTPGKQFYVAL